MKYTYNQKEFHSGQMTVEVEGWTTLGELKLALEKEKKNLEAAISCLEIEQELESVQKFLSNHEGGSRLGSSWDDDISLWGLQTHIQMCQNIYRNVKDKADLPESRFSPFSVRSLEESIGTILPTLEDAYETRDAETFQAALDNATALLDSRISSLDYYDALKAGDQLKLSEIAYDVTFFQKWDFMEQIHYDELLKNPDLVCPYKIDCGIRDGLRWKKIIYFTVVDFGTGSNDFDAMMDTTVLITETTDIFDQKMEDSRQ